MRHAIPILIASLLIAGCTVTPTSPQPAATETPAPATATTQPAPPATETTAATATESATATTPATATATTEAPAVTPTAAPQPAGRRAVVQTPDNKVNFVDAAGAVTALGSSPVRLANISGLPFTADATRDTLFGIAAGTASAPPAAYAVSATGAQALPYVGRNPVGVAAWQGKAGETLVAWGNYTTTENGGTTNILIGKPDGSDVHAVVTETAQGILANLLPLRWSADGKTLYYSSEPTGLGGYILFGGFSGLYKLDVASATTSTLIPSMSLGMVCLDDLSADLGSLVEHCGDKAIHVLNLSTQQTTTITLPASVTDAAALGTARFNPDGTRVAFAMARRDPSNEQGWIAVSDGLSGASKLITTSVPGAYLLVAGWLDANTIVFQSASMSGAANEPNTVWAINADGTNLRQLAQGDVLTVAAAPGGPASSQPGGVQALSMASDSEAIRLSILRGFTTWQTLFADATQIIYPGPSSSGASKDGPARVHAQVWINQPRSVRFLSGPEGERPEVMDVSAGSIITTTNLRTGESNRTPLKEMLPSASQDASDKPVAHPLTAVGSLVMLSLLPGGMAQPGGTYTPLRMEQVAGRDALVVDWQPPQTDTCMGFGCTKTRLWVDTLTGVWLHAREADDAALSSEMIINAIRYNPDIPAGIFNPPAGLGADFVSPTGDDLAGLKQFENREVNLAFHVPATWDVLEPDHNAAGIQIIMGPQPISWTSTDPIAVQISIADNSPTAMADELSMLATHYPGQPTQEAITLPSGLPAQRVIAPGQALGAPETHTVWYVVEFGHKLVFLSMDSARANISWEKLLSTFGPLDGTKPAGQSLD